ncbi:hypothetical protein J3R83DRAFT_13024 [Lanmaoa asiatica]|nr:hypothetical protein J3R83DRAFT_13024 [Lanmaoa asiatica]
MLFAVDLRQTPLSTSSPPTKRFIQTRNRSLKLETLKSQVLYHPRPPPAMQAIRKRNPFTFESENHVNGRGVLDEQEQAEMVDHIKEQNISSNKQNRIALQLMLGLSCILYVIYMLSDRTTPLFAIFPPPLGAGRANAPLDMSGILAYVAILVHVNLSLIVHPWNVVIAGRVIRAIGFLETFAWSAAAPLLSVYSGRAWQTTAWWCIPALLTYVVYAVHGWIRKADEDVSELEKLKYRAPVHRTSSDCVLSRQVETLGMIRLLVFAMSGFHTVPLVKGVGNVVSSNPRHREYHWTLFAWNPTMILGDGADSTGYLVDAVCPPTPMQIFTTLLKALRGKNTVFKHVMIWHHTPTMQSFLVHVPLLQEKITALLGGAGECVFVKLDRCFSVTREPSDRLREALRDARFLMAESPDVLSLSLSDAFTEEILIPLAAVMIDYPVAYFPAFSAQTSFLGGTLDIYTVSFKGITPSDSTLGLGKEHVLLKFSCPQALVSNYAELSPGAVIEKLKVKFTSRLERIGTRVFVTHRTETLDRVAL